MIYSKHGLFLEEITWFIWNLVFHIHRDYKYVQSPKYSLWCNKEPGGVGVEVGQAEKTESVYFMTLKELRNPF